MKEENTVLHRVRGTEIFRKEEFEFWKYYFQDPKTGKEFTKKALDDLNTSQVHNQYRAKYHIPFPGEIKQIRLAYGLSASKMSEILDFGINSYRNYEAGEIPSLANAKLIRLAKNAPQFKSFVEEKKDIFSVNGYRKVMDRIQILLQPNELEPIVEYLWNHDMEANAFTGYIKPNFDKVANYVLFFAEKLQPLKTKLNKLLFYSDFLNFKQTGFAISGCNYRAITLGPVPSHFSELFGLLEDQGFIQIEHEVLDRGVGERFVPGKDFDASLFTEQELDSMQKVVNAFQDYRTKEIVDLSHEETAWLENHEEKNLIDYRKYGFDIKGV